MATIVCVDDEVASLHVLSEMLCAAGHRSIPVKNAAACMNVLERGGVDLVISDYRMPDTTGLELMDRVREEAPGIPVVIATGYATVEHAVASIKAGAVDYITKPFRAPQIHLVVDQALELSRLKRENEALREEVSQYRTSRSVIGEKEGMQAVMRTVGVVAPTRATVLLHGESGTGKELIARALHDLSPRRDEPFVSVNCAALPETLVESMLFGHEKGAFTGALKQVKGAFERAHRGTLLLDEISEMRLDLQAKLLRVIQEQEFERVGGTTPVRVDVRIVATTNRNLAEEVREGRFREDLYYRLSVVPLRLPPLRDRREDIPALVQHFMQCTARELGKTVTGVSAEAIELLQSKPWPGNVRELAHAVERAVILSMEPILGPDVFGLDGKCPSCSVAFDPIVPDAPVAGRVSDVHDPIAPDGVAALKLDSLSLAEAEQKLIEQALATTGHNRTQAADLLGISVRTLRNKLNRPIEN